MKPTDHRHLACVLSLAAALAFAFPAAAAAQTPAAGAGTTARAADDELAPDEVEVDTPPALEEPAQVAWLARQLYPDSLRRAGTEGTVLLRIMVHPGGRIPRGGVDVVSATHPEFALAARRLVQRLRFRPATLQGREVAAPFTLPVAFVLHDR